MKINLLCQGKMEGTFDPLNRRGSAVVTYIGQRDYGTDPATTTTTATRGPNVIGMSQFSGITAAGTKYTPDSAFLAKYGTPSQFK